MNERIVDSLDIDNLPSGEISKVWLNLVTDGMGKQIQIPILVAKGTQKGKTLGITAALHGNELNGISVIQKLFSKLDIQKLAGVIIGVPVVNVPSFHRKKRRFIDNTDLNHVMPGKKNGNVSQVYAHRLVHKLIKSFDYLVDLHTASNGRINSYYIRADMDDKVVKKMAILQNAQIIVHNPPKQSTLRGFADGMHIPAITLEVGDPNLFQKGVIRDSLTGIHNLLGYLQFTDDIIEKTSDETVLCKKSYWIYTQNGGILTVHPKVAAFVTKGDKIATLKDIFGEVIEEYVAPEDGIVIGKSVSPVNLTGGRILHLGILKKEQLNHNKSIQE